MTIPLDYQGGPGSPAGPIDDTSAFHARRRTGREGTVLAGGDYLYRIYPTPQRVFFIKIDSGTNVGMAVTFGALGLWLQKAMTKNKERARLAALMASYAGQRPALLLAQSPENHVLPREEVRNPVLDGPSFWTGGKFGRWTFKDGKNKKRTFFFEDVENFQAAAAYLGAAFGTDLLVRARYDPAKKKIVQVKG